MSMPGFTAEAALRGGAEFEAHDWRHPRVAPARGVGGVRPSTTGPPGHDGCYDWTTCGACKNGSQTCTIKTCCPGGKCYNPDTYKRRC
jgi:hypothetical protein